ncbi:MAG: undecaprenyldiphospho-muramoylpentapeptide beta-N-acetylglucosaminyltransferase [Bacteroidia bacterium]|nr:MAG: undecaprenyldiphospho-muramoylpentapeptide beta-N-acetylglucosaminyltransferase [Bacteroidia bacterium]
MKTKKILISGGGTGGHIFPAIAIAQALKVKDPSVEILFVGAKGKIEERVVPQAGFDIELLNIRGFERKISLENFKNLYRLFGALRRSRKILKRFKPDVAVGVGGYASGPMLRVAANHGVPLVLQEQNSYPGITNRLLAKSAKKICVAYEGLERFFPKEKIVKTGNPVRKNIEQTTVRKQEARAFFEVPENLPVILSLGGSGGARSINEGIKNELKKIAESEVCLIWQTGKRYYADAQEEARKYNSTHIKPMPFISEMDKAYAAADLVISRAGAATVSELCLLGKPSILVPSPNVTEDHQTKNAETLVQKKAAVLLRDDAAKKELVSNALEIIHNPLKLNELADNIAKEKMPNADAIIADEVLKLIKE